MAVANQRITQRGLGVDEEGEVEAERIDAWWNPPPTPPLSCPSSVPPASGIARGRHATISLEIDETDETEV
jgi:hypothetical protein